jgi:parallel beta-helix repeat protein
MGTDETLWPWFCLKAEVEIMKTGPSVGDLPGHGCAAVAFFCLWLAVLLATGSAATYYVDTNHAGARDTNPGSEALPFKTIGKATSLVNAGDTVFVKAGIYRETILLTRSGTQTKPITIRARPGQEGKVILNAAEPVTNWRQCTGPQECAGNPNWAHVYWADVAALVQAHPDKAFAVRQVFQQGLRLPRSRYPDTGWHYPTAIVDAKTAFSDATLVQPRAYFNGAVCHIKTRMWRIDQIPVTDFSGATFTLARSPFYDMSTRYGYYLTSIVGEINEEGEWAYDPALKKLYLWPRGDMLQDVEFTYRRYCVQTNSGVSFNVVRGFTMRNAYQHGVWLYRADHVTIESNTIEYAFTYGVELQSTGGSCNNNQIRGNTIQYSGYRGINVSSQASSCNVEGNTVYATGVEHFGEDLMNGPSEAIYIDGPRARVYHNRIDRAGHVGLYVEGPARSRDISYNYVTNIGLALADTGGIYTAGFTDGSEVDHIHHNIIEDAFGCLTMDRQYDAGAPPTPETHSGVAHGIYVDEEGSGRLIEYNTAINCSMSGICFHLVPSSVVQNNTLYGNHAGQVAFSGRNEARKRLIEDTLVDNILFATAAGQKTLYLTMNYDDVRFGQSDRNYFYHPYDHQHIFLSRYPSSGGVRQEDLSLTGWRALSGYDLQSRDFSSLEQHPDISLAEPRTSRIVYNPTLDVAIVDLEGRKYCDVQGNEVSGSVTLQPFEPRILIAVGAPTPESQEQATE